jgi:hypothetical protein
VRKISDCLQRKKEERQLRTGSNCRERHSDTGRSGADDQQVADLDEFLATVDLKLLEVGDLPGYRVKRRTSVCVGTGDVMAPGFANEREKGESERAKRTEELEDAHRREKFSDETCALVGPDHSLLAVGEHRLHSVGLGRDHDEKD